MFALINKALLFLTLSGVAVGLLGFMGYRTTSLKLTSLESQYSELQSDYRALTKERDNLILGQEVSSEVVVSLVTSLYEIEDGRDAALARLSSLTGNSDKCNNVNLPPSTPLLNDKGEAIETVDITMPFSVEFRDAIRLSPPRT